MPTLLLIRHGENEYVKQGRLPGRLPGIHLNEHGQAQAKALAESLKSLPIRAIYASPLERAIETAEPLAQALGFDIQLRPALLDTHVGEWEGQLLKKLRKLPLWKLDAAPQSVLDAILWKSVYGVNSAPPPPGPNAENEQ